MFLSVFDLFKIGIGPSSSHTMGPMLAANMFLDELGSNNWPRPSQAKVYQIRAYLYGSLAFTGIGHATDRAVLLGLMGQTPANIDIDEAENLIKEIHISKKIKGRDGQYYQFDPQKNVIFDYDTVYKGHANAMAFEALDKNDAVLLRRVYYSIGGGFVVTEDELNRTQHHQKSQNSNVPYPFETAKSMLSMAQKHSKSIAEMKRANEEKNMSRAELNKRLEAIYGTMRSCVERGLIMEGELPGGLKVKRRAKKLYAKLEEDWQKNSNNPLLANDYLACYAMAVNEENAAGGRVVTAPTNGASGVIPAVLNYYMRFHQAADKEFIYNFLLTAAAIGGIIKHNASISGAEVGCQGEVGSAAAMAASGLVAALGGTPEQVENAAEIALEHHLGMTCDPVAGLVQVPCIERNALGAVKAVTAASLALHGDGRHFVSLDACIKTMKETGKDMSENYKETSKAGLAVNVIEC